MIAKCREHQNQSYLCVKNDVRSTISVIHGHAKIEATLFKHLSGQKKQCVFPVKIFLFPVRDFKQKTK